MLCFDKDLLGNWMAKELDMIFTPQKSTCIGLVKEGKIAASVWYEDYTKKSVMCHIVIKSKINKEYLRVIFDYPFKQLNVDKIIVPIKSNNTKSIKFVGKLGFKEEARLLDVFPDADLLFFNLLKGECKFLGERYGKVGSSATSA